ncbi:MAG: D-aminoacyl-tRNA deacylase [Thermoplasmata archaeon]|nr:MAG: D-aminoacyl-tRNA deacylase [Thermoplasmata archaeon]
MKIENLIVVSLEDTASCNIKKFLLELGEWQQHDPFESNPTFVMGNSIIVTIEPMHLYCDNIDKKVGEHFGFEAELVIFLSRHRSESGLKTLTVHPVGNYADAKFGGMPGKLVPSSPRRMTSALRVLKREGAELIHQISYEATHHGPYLTTPAFYIEIGSDASAWEEPKPAEAIAKTLLTVLAEEEDPKDRIAIGIGGGHYVPRLTDIACSHHIAFGHMVPVYAVDMENEMYMNAIKATPGADCVYFHKKSLKKSRYRELAAWCESEGGLEVVDSKTLEAI